jgi:hypothetical protein
MWIDAEDGGGADASSGTAAVQGSAITVTGEVEFEAYLKPPILCRSGTHIATEKPDWR